MIAEKILKNDYPNLYDNHIALDDRLEIHPFLGRKRTFELKRVQYFFEGRQDYKISLEKGFEISLPCPLGKDLEMKLSRQDNELFLLESFKRPFRINGVYTFSAYIQHGDEVFIHYNKLIFLKKNHKLNETCCGPSIDIMQSTINILLEGETGSGKSHLAKIIHENSERIGGFVHLNLASFSKGILESELFGHKKGAFTGALQEKMGAIEEAHRGTLFLDEVDSLPLEIQTKLLLFLDSKKFRKVGDLGEKSVDVRLIFASGRNLKKMSERGEFRKDLYFRISSGMYHKIRPLRENKKLIETLIDQFSHEHNILLSKHLKDLYVNCVWPGNIRELLGHLELKKVISKGRVIEYCQADKKLFKVEGIEDPQFANITLEEMKKNYVQEIYMLKRKNKSHTCQVLGISKNTLNRFLAS